MVDRREETRLMVQHRARSEGHECEAPSQKKGAWSTGAAALACVAVVILGSVLLSSGQQQAPVALEAGNGAGYLSAGVEGIASKVLLEQAQEASELARKRLEQAAAIHNRADELAKTEAEVAAQEAAARKESLGDQEDADAAEKRGGNALVDAKQAHLRLDGEVTAAKDAQQESADLSRKAVAFGEEGDKAKANSLAASAEARKAKAGLRRLKDQIQATMIDLEALKKQLVVSGNYVPAEEQPVGRESLASSPRGVWGRSASHRQQRQRGARGGAAKQLGIADERVPVDVVSGKQAQY